MGKRITALLLGLCLLAGCATDAAQSLSPEAPVTLDWFVNFSWFTAAWGENHVTQAITRQTGTRVDFSSPVGSENETLDAMLQGKELPDLITLGWWLPQVGELIDSGRVYPLEELAQQYAPEFFDAASQEVLDWYRQDDGAVYCYPSASSSPAAYADGAIAPSNQVFLVRKDLYKALGSPDMTTPEGFADTLRRAKEAFPFVNGYPLLTMGCGEFNEQGCASFSEHLRDLLALPQERDAGVYVHGNVEALLRADPTTRATFYEKMIQNSVFNPDECRAKEEKNPIPGGWGKRFLVTKNLGSLESVLKGEESNA